MTTLHNLCLSTLLSVVTHVLIVPQVSPVDYVKSNHYGKPSDKYFMILMKSKNGVVYLVGSQIPSKPIYLIRLYRDKQFKLFIA